MDEPVFDWINRENLESFFTDTVLPTMIASPNSFLTLLPQQVNGLLDMKLQVVDFNQVIYEDDNELIYRESTQEGDDLAFYTDNSNSTSNIIILNREGGYLYNHKLELISNIDFEALNNKYWFKLGGLKVMGTQGFYQSYFKGSIDKSIIATRIFSDMELLRMRLANPITIMKKLPCSSCDGGGNSSCSSCKGTGQVELKPSIASVFYFNDFDISGGNKTSLDDIIRYIQPPVESVELQMKHYEYHSNEVKEGLNNFYFKHSQSGVAKEVDREDKVASTEVILFRLFSLASDILNSYSETVTINKELVYLSIPSELVTNGKTPKAIDGYSASELVERYLAYYRNKYKDDAIYLRLYTYAIMNDFLFPYTAEEKKTIGTIEQVNYSNQLPLAILKVKETYKEKIRLATDSTIKKWLDSYILPLLSIELDDTNIPTI
jgi:hypothetical protein